MSHDIIKRLHIIDRMFYNEGDITLTGMDENGKEFSVTMPVLEVLEWVKTKDLKTEAIKYINEL